MLGLVILVCIPPLMWAIISGDDVQGVIASAIFTLATVALVQSLPDEKEEVQCQIQEVNTVHDVEPRPTMP